MNLKSDDMSLFEMCLHFPVIGKRINLGPKKNNELKEAKMSRRAKTVCHYFQEGSVTKSNPFFHMAHS